LSKAKSTGTKGTTRPGISARPGSALSAADLPGAVKSELPKQLSPQLATLSARVPASGSWIYEIKFDGYRIMARIDQGCATLWTRGGNDWSARMPVLVKELEGLGISSAWLDGEVVVLGTGGLPDFNALQNAFDQPRSSATIDYFLFDLPFYEGYDLRKVALQGRRKLLKEILESKVTEHVRFSADFDAAPATILASARAMNLEGVIAKRADAPYVSRRTDTWLKLKGKQRQEFVVCGYTDRSGSSREIGSLLLGVYDASGALLSVGSVGTGWSSADAVALKGKLVPLEIAGMPFAGGTPKAGRWSKRSPGSERWVEPRLVAEVEFAEWTPDGQIRHPSFKGLRMDKAATKVVRESGSSP
jgi:bifunctional non-homologous end joining protein LigD